MKRRIAFDPFVVGAICLLAAALATALQNGSSLEFVRLNAQLLLHVLCASAVIVASLRTSDPAVKLFWRWFGGGLLLWLVLPFLSLAGPDGELSIWGAVVEDSLYLVVYLLFIFGLECAFVRARPDIATMPSRAGAFVFAGSLFVYFIVIPALWNPEAYGELSNSYFFFASLDAFIATRVALLLYSEEKGSRSVYGWLLAMAICWVGSDLLAALRHMEGVVSIGDQWPSFGNFAFFAIVVAARLSAFSPEGRVREMHPFPLMTAPSVLISYSLVLPAVHLVMHIAGFLDATSQTPREIVIIVCTGTLVSLGIRTRLTQRSQHGSTDQFRVTVSEEQVSRWRHVDALGQLAGAMVHDFSNVLMVIRGYTELLLDSIDEGRPDRGCAEQVQVATDRARSMTEQLLAFGRRQRFDNRVIDVNAVIQETRPMLAQILGANVRIEVAGGARNCWVNGDVGQLTQVVLNLGVNARAAMPDGGVFKIETTNVELEARGDEKQYIKRGSYVMVRISDTGIGMDDLTAKHIFEPFFTTRTRQGTGLGLSTVFGIIRQSGGYIDVISAPAQGTTFEIFLPRVAAPAVSAAPAPDLAIPSTVEGDETILLVEDEPDVRHLTAGYLRSKGYSVVEAQHAAEALRRLEEADEPVGLLLTDIAMPEIDGHRLAELVRQLIPGIGVVYMSTYPSDPGKIDGQGRSAFVQKPFALDSLGRVVRRVLDSRVD